MVIGRGRRREHPQPTFCTNTTTKKKVRGKKGWEKRGGEKKKGKWYGEKREKSTGGKYGKKYRGKLRGKVT